MQMRTQRLHMSAIIISGCFDVDHFISYNSYAHRDNFLFNYNSIKNKSFGACLVVK